MQTGRFASRFGWPAPSRGPNVCVPCRFVAKDTQTCPQCGEAMKYTGTKWRAPKKSNDKAWKKIEQGDWLWDDKAKSRWPKYEPGRYEGVGGDRNKPHRRRSLIPRWFGF